MDSLIDQFAKLAVSRRGPSVDRHQIADLVQEFCSLSLDAESDELINAIHSAVRSLVMKPPCRPRNLPMETSRTVF